MLGMWWFRDLEMAPDILPSYEAMDAAEGLKI